MNFISINIDFGNAGIVIFIPTEVEDDRLQIILGRLLTFLKPLIKKSLPLGGKD